MKLRLAIALTLFSSVSGCTGEAGSSSAKVTDSSAGTVTLASRPYRGMSLTAAGAVAGTVTPAGEALVWIDDITAGKSVGEILRRTVTIENGRFVPSIQDVPVGATINVFTRDRAPHAATFTLHGEQVAEVRTTDAGQVVPSETIADRAGLVHARMDGDGGASGYVAAFDHPYHTVTDGSGAFRIDSLPPGTYTLKVWREGLSEPVAQRVTITAGGVGQVDLTLGPAPAPLAPPGAPVADSVSASDSVGHHRDE